MNLEVYLSNKYELAPISREGYYRTVCPFCQHHNNKFYIMFPISAFNCFHCGMKGSLRKLLWLKHREDYKLFGGDSNKWVSTEIEKDKLSIDLPEPHYNIISNDMSQYRVKLYNYMLDRGLDKKTIESIGAVCSPTMNDHIIFPIRDVDRKIVYWVTRSISESGQSKSYLPFSPVGYYGKGDVLYNIHNAIHHPIVYITEGVFSCLSLTSCGYNAVALLGKSISQQQINILFNCEFSEIILLLDGDASNEAVTILNTLRKNGILQVSMIDIPISSDPNDLLLTGMLVPTLLGGRSQRILKRIG